MKYSVPITIEQHTYITVEANSKEEVFEKLDQMDTDDFVANYGVETVSLFEFEFYTDGVTLEDIAEE